MGLFQSISGRDGVFAGEAAALLAAGCIQQQKLEDACGKSKQLEKEVEELRKQSQKAKGLAACSLFGLQQQQLSSAKSVKKLSLACGQLSLHSAIVQDQYEALLQQLGKCKQQHGESELVMERQIAKLQAKLASKGEKLADLQAQAALKGKEVADLQAAHMEVEEKLLVQEQEVARYKAQVAAKGDQLAAKSDQMAVLHADKVAAEHKTTSQDEEIAALKAKLTAKEEEAARLKAAKAEAEQKLLLQVEAGKAALQAQAETRAALAASQEVNEKLLMQQKTDRDALAALQEEVEAEKAKYAYADQRIAQCLCTIQGLNKIVFARKTVPQEIKEQGNIIKLLGIVVQHQEDQKTEAAAHIKLELEPEVTELKAKVADFEGKVSGLEGRLAEAHSVVVEQYWQLVEKERELQQSGRGGYGAFIGAVDRHGRVSKVLRECRLDSEAVLNTPAAALCIAAGLSNSSHGNLQRVYHGLSLACHPDHIGGKVELQKQLNQVWRELEKELAAAPAH